MKRIYLISMLAVALMAIPSANAYEQGDYIFRAGLTMVDPDSSSSNVFVDGTDLGVGVSVENNTQLGVNFAYFFRDQWSLELLAATPFKHDVNLDTVGRLGEVKHLPPTLTANYYFNDPAKGIQPYIGAGINYTFIFSEKFTPANRAAGFGNLDADNSFGLSAQVGVDFMLSGPWHLNASARWIDIDTDATFRVAGDPGRVSISIDPWVYTLSVGYRF